MRRELPLPVASSRDFVKPGVHPLPDVSLGSWNGQTDLLGNGFEVFRLELLRERIPEGFQQKWLLCLAYYHLGTAGGQFLDDAEHVLLEHFADGHCGLVVILAADARAVHNAVLHYPQRR